MSEIDTAKKFQFIAGNLALDFCNTMGGKRGAVEREYLSSPIQYLAWCEQAHILTREQAERSLQKANNEPEQSSAFMRRAVELREAIFRIFQSQSTVGESSGVDIEILNRELSLALPRLKLQAGAVKGAYSWEWTFDEDSMDRPLGPVAHAAATLLTDPRRLAHVRMCQGGTCGWLFLDSSRNHSRCWCDMRDCGNLAKIRRHRLKQRSAQATESTSPEKGRAQD